MVIHGNVKDVDIKRILKTRLKYHLFKRQNACLPLKSDIDIEILRKNFETIKVKEYICPKCNKNFSTSSNLSKHKKICKSDYVEMTNQIKRIAKECCNIDEK